MSRERNENPFGHDFSLLIRNGQGYPGDRQPSVVLVDWSRMQYVDLLETEFEVDEHILMIRRLMIHKKLIGSYVSEVVSAEVEPVTNMFGFQRYMKHEAGPAYHFRYTNVIRFN